MLETPLTAFERETLIEFIGPAGCAECRGAEHELCDRHAVLLRYEATVRANLLLSEADQGFLLIHANEREERGLVDAAIHLRQIALSGETFETFHAKRAVARG